MKIKKFNEISKINETVEYSDERIEKAVRIADDVFWGAIATEFPEITSGDFPPDAHIAFQNAQIKAVKLWLDINSSSDDKEY
jgi:hypothetical protein